MAGERTVYVKVGIKADPALAGLRQLQTALNGIAKSDVRKTKSGVDSLGKANDSGLRRVKSSLDAISKQDLKKPKAALDGLHGGRSVSELRKLQSSMEKIDRQNFNKVQRSLDGVNTRKSQASLDGLFSRANLLGGAVALGIGKAIASFADFDQAMSGVAANSGATGGELDALRDKAIELGSATQFSATEAAQGVNELAKAGVSNQEILNGGLQGALDLAAAGQIGVAQAAETTASALNQFEQDGSQATHVADLLSNAANAAQGGVGDMGQALGQAGVAAHAAGMDLDETTTLLALFAKAGLVGSDAGTSLKTMMQRLSAPTADAAAEMETLGINAYDAQGNFVGAEALLGQLAESTKTYSTEAKMAAFNTIFGSDAIRAASISAAAGADGYKKMNAEVTKVGGAAENAAKLTDNWRGDLERLGGAIDTAFIQGGSGANDALRTLTQTAEGLVTGISQIPGPLALSAAGLGAMVALGPKLGELGDKVGGPVRQGMQRFREEMKLQEALSGAASRSYDGLGDSFQRSGEKVKGGGQKFTSGMGAAKAAVGGLKGAAGGLMGLLGGPWGIALAGATAVVGLWAQKQADAAEAARVLNSTVDKQTDKFTAASKESVLSAFADALAPEDLKRVQDLGVNLGDVSDALLEGGPRAAAMKDQLKGMADERAGIFGSDDARLLEALMNSFDTQAAGAEKVRAALALLRDEKNKQIVADSRQAGSASDAERLTSDLGGAIKGVTDYSKDTVGPLGDMNKALGDTKDNAKDAATELQGMLDRFDLLAGGKRALSAADRGISDAKDAALAAAKDKGGKDPAAVAAAAKAKEDLDRAEEDLAKARGKGGKPAKGNKDAIDNAELSLKHALEHQKTVQANSKATASMLESARQRVESARQRLSQAQGKGAATTAKADTTAEERRVADAKDALAEANKRVAESFVAPQKAQEKYEAAQGALAEAGEKKIAELQKQTKPIYEIRDAYDNTKTALTEAAKARGIHGKALDAELAKYLPTETALKELLDTYEETPAYKATQITTPGLPQAKKAVEGYWQVVDGRPHFIKAEATTPGLPKAKKDVEGYWSVIDGHPKYIPTTLETKGAEKAKADVQGVWTVIDGHPHLIPITVKVFGLEQLQPLAAAISAIPGGGMLGVALNAAALAGVKRATGGPIFGPGTGTSDSIPAMLSNGEHVLTAAEVAAAGGHGAILSLRKAILSGGVQFRAAGGPVAAPTTAYRPAPAPHFRLPAEMVNARGGDTVTVNAYGHDSKTAVRQGLREYFWERDHGR